MWAGALEILLLLCYIQSFTISAANSLFNLIFDSGPLDYPLDSTSLDKLLALFPKFPFKQS